MEERENMPHVADSIVVRINITKQSTSDLHLVLFRERRKRWVR